MKLQEFNTVVQAVCRRPGLYVGHSNFEMAACYLEGYASCISKQNGKTWYIGQFNAWLWRTYQASAQVGYRGFLKDHTRPFAALGEYFQMFINAVVPPLEQLADAADEGKKEIE